MRKSFAAVCCLAGLSASALLAEPRARFLWGDGEAKYTTLPADRSVQANAGTVQNWTGSFTSSGTNYTFTMVGTDPSQGSVSTVVPVQIIPLIFQFSDGTVLDPTQPACGTARSSVDSVTLSPIFQSSTFAPGGTNVGNTQYVDAFQRANFWNFVSSTAPDYHVLLGTPQVMPAVTLSVPSTFGHTVAGPCAKIGEVSLAYFQLQLRKLTSAVPSTSLPLLLTYNTFFTQGGCCILGFHTAQGRAPNQLTISVAAYSDPGIFSVPIQDIHALSHEIGEWMDDPFVNNTVPGWTGGQVGGACDTLLEVGDPVTGIAFQVTMNGQTYNPEDLVFLPWFEKAVPSSSVNGWYTFLNTYSGPVNCN
jgi:hypothetical protein